MEKGRYTFVLEGSVTPEPDEAIFAIPVSTKLIERAQGDPEMTKALIKEAQVMIESAIREACGVDE